MATKLVNIFHLLDQKKPLNNFLSPSLTFLLRKRINFDEEMGTNCSAVGNNPKP